LLSLLAAGEPAEDARLKGDASIDVRLKGLADTVVEGDGAAGEITLDWIGGADGPWTDVGRPPGVSVRTGCLEIVGTSGIELVRTMPDDRRLCPGLAGPGVGDCMEERGVEFCSGRVEREGRSVVDSVFMPA
jgi:hypothetical protein